MRHKVLRIRADDLGFFNKSLEQHVDEFTSDGSELIAVVPSGGDMVLIGRIGQKGADNAREKAETTDTKDAQG